MIYWKIRTPGKSWSTWADGVSDDNLDAEVDSMYSVLDENNQLLPWAAAGINVEMYECISIDDFRINEDKAKSFRTNYLGMSAGE